LVKTEVSQDISLNHTTKDWPFDRESIGLPVKSPQGACPSRVGTERCGKDKDPDDIVGRLYQVWHKEMKEMRLNHCRDIVTNLVDTQNRRDQRPEGTSHVNVNLYSCHDGYPVQRWHDLMSGSITEQGKLAESA